MINEYIEKQYQWIFEETLQIGNRYRPGVYFVEVTQGKKKKTQAYKVVGRPSAKEIKAHSKDWVFI